MFHLLNNFPLPHREANSIAHSWLILVLTLPLMLTSVITLRFLRLVEHFWDTVHPGILGSLSQMTRSDPELGQSVSRIRTD